MELILLFHFFRPFIPIYSFTLPYLTKEKQISIQEFNKMISLFFITSLFSNFLGLFYISIFSSKSLLIIESILELLYYFNLLICNKRILKYNIILHAISSSFSIFTKDLLLVNKNNQKMYLNYNFIKRIAAILSGWLGQDLLFYTGDFKPIVIISIFSCFMTFLISLFVKNTRKKSIIFLNDFFKKSILDSLKNNNISFYLLTYIISSLIYISFSFYAANIFIERKKDISTFCRRFSKILRFILKPLRLISIFYIYILSFFITIEKNTKKSEILHGYIDGLAKFTGILISFILSNLIQNLFNFFYLKILTLFLLKLSIIFTFFMGTFKNLIFIYLIYILNISITNFLLILSFNQFKIISNFNILYGFIILFCNVVHLLVIFSEKQALIDKKILSCQKRMIKYLYVYLPLYFLCIILVIY